MTNFDENRASSEVDSAHDRVSDDCGFIAEVFHLGHRWSG
jgi:hypothetical protein